MTTTRLTTRMDETQIRMTSLQPFALTSRSTAMYTLHEALAREHLRQLHEDARHRAFVNQLAAAKRWQKRERRAHAAYRRSAQRAEYAAQASAVSV